MTEAWKQDHHAEDSHLSGTNPCTQNERVFWSARFINHGCGLVGFLHCVRNVIDIHPKSGLDWRMLYITLEYF